MQEFFIWSEEHGAWWKADGQGYTSQLRQAGHYSPEEAHQIVQNGNVGLYFNETKVAITPDIQDLLNTGTTPR